nr:MAG TPA: hypothetical protein [Caudoviricetes sp.]
MLHMFRYHALNCAEFVPVMRNHIRPFYMSSCVYNVTHVQISRIKLC